MPRYAIVTDTDSSLPVDLAAAHGIRLVPINIHFPDNTICTDFDTSTRRVFERIDQDGRLPTTSAPVPGAFAQVFQEALSHGADGIICLCVSSAISATYSAARVAAESLPQADITIVDSQTLSMAQGFMALAAAEAARTGASKEEILQAVESVRRRTVLYGALATLRYLAMSGRVGTLAAGVADLLNIRPILSVQEGKLDLLERVRTRKRAWARMIELCQEAVTGRSIERWALLHADARDEAEAFGTLLQTALGCPIEPIVAELAPGLSIHTGTGLVGVALVHA